MFSKLTTRFGPVRMAVALAAAVALLAGAADARPLGGSSFGSRGSRTYTAPPSTATAPKTAAPVERSMTQPGSTQTGAAGAAASASRFGGIGSLLMGGLIGAGLASLFGLGAFANVLGFLLQAALIGGVIWLAFNYFRSRNPQPALAGANRGYGRPQAANQPAAGGSSSPSGLNIAPDDFNAFERLLGEIQVAFGKGDMTALGERLTPEMLSYFAGELDANARKRVRNEVSQPKLLQGDLAEAWRESNGEYATVAMRYSIVDATVDIQSGQVVDGSKTAAQQVTEIWTFRRPRGGNAQQWQLSAIQQTRG